MTATVASGSLKSSCAELQAGDGFFTPEQGSQIVVKCILGKFYDHGPVQSNVTVNERPPSTAMTHGWWSRISPSTLPG